MIRLDFKSLAKEINGRLLSEDFSSAIFEGVAIDSRTVADRQLFIAIKGDKDDGHNYIGDVLKRGSSGLIISHEIPNLNEIAGNFPVIMVDDTHLSMMQLAARYRLTLPAKFIAITGSNGKTTTKEFVAAMISFVDKNTFRSPGNLNNLFGLPLAILGMDADAHYGIFELGISYPGEMTRLAEMIKADLALITNVGPTHLETLGTVEGVAEAKLELVDALPAEKPVIINADNAELMKAARKRNRSYATYGIESPSDFTAERLGLSKEGYPMLRIDGAEVAVKLFGDHQAYNLLAGYATCKVLGLNINSKDLNRIEYKFAPYRGEIENIKGLTVIADCYNANPVSMQSGLASFRNYLRNPVLENRRSLAIVGDMLELGKDAVRFHQEAGALLAQMHFDLAVAVGPLSQEIYRGAIRNGFDEKRIVHFDDLNIAGEYLIGVVKRGDIIYLKASRGIGLEKLITLLKGSAFRQN